MAACMREQVLYTCRSGRHKQLSVIISRAYSTIRSQGSAGRVWVALGVFGGLSLGAAYTFKAQYAHVVRDEYPLSNPSKPSITLYQYQTCPFCCKVRAYLDYYGMDYTTVEVNPLTRKELNFSQYKKVPTAVVDNKQINDSSVIISAMHSHSLGKQSLEIILTYYPEMRSTDENGKEVAEFANRHAIMYMEGVDKKTQENLMEERKWRAWVDSTFVHTLSPNIYRTSSEAMQAFEYFSSVGNFSAWERYAVRYCGAVVMYVLGKHLKNRYRLNDDVRQSLYEEAEKWIKVVGKRRFMGGSSPNLADLAVYGVLSGLEGLDMHTDLMTHTNIKPWYDRVKHAVKTHAGAVKLQ